MRRRNMIAVGLLSAVVALACSSSSSSNPPGSTDAGGQSSGGSSGGSPTTDASAGAEDAATDAAVACVIDADLQTIAPPDGALDDAGDSVGTCLGCAKTTCASDLSTCNADCTCNTSFACFANCIGGVGNTLLSCVGQCFSGGITAVANNPLVLCVAKSCATPCAIGALIGGGGGSDAGGPGSADASGDAPAD